MWEFKASSFFCMASKRGKAVFIITIIRRIKIGITTSTTTESWAFIISAIISAPISIPGARSIMRRAMLIRFCTWVMSFVSLVTREPVLNLSRLAKENFCTLSNTSLRKSEAKLIDALAAK